MPELPEVESVRRLCERVLVGHKIVRAEAAEDSIVYESPAQAVEQTLGGATVTGTGRIGKVFWWCLNDGKTLFGHLGMSGWVREVGGRERRLVSHGAAPMDDTSGRPKFLKLLVTTEDGRCLAFTDGRRLARIWLGGDPSQDQRIVKLGPDAWTGKVDCSKLLESKAPVKSLLLDQSRFAGVGNWVADEVLLAARISPHRAGESLTQGEISALCGAITQVLDIAVDADADPSRYPENWLFHVRWGGGKGPQTLCGKAIRRDKVGGRTAAWVPELQH